MLEGKSDQFFPWLNTLTVWLFIVFSFYFPFFLIAFSLLFLFTTRFSSVIFSVQLYWWESYVELCVVASLGINYNVVILIHKLVNGFRKFMQLLAWAVLTNNPLFSQQLRKFINTFHPLAMAMYYARASIQHLLFILLIIKCGFLGLNVKVVKPRFGLLITNKISKGKKWFYYPQRIRLLMRIQLFQQQFTWKVTICMPL